MSTCTESVCGDGTVRALPQLVLNHKPPSFFPCRICLRDKIPLTLFHKWTSPSLQPAASTPRWSVFRLPLLPVALLSSARRVMTAAARCVYDICFMFTVPLGLVEKKIALKNKSLNKGLGKTRLYLIILLYLSFLSTKYWYILNHEWHRDGVCYSWKTK